MISLFQSALYLSGCVAVVLLLILPAVFLAVVCTVYMVFEAFWFWRERRHVV